MSPCGNYLITCGRDSLIFVYEITIVSGDGQAVKRSDYSNLTVVDDFLSDVVLINKK